MIFGRDRPDRRGATLYVRGNEQIYGDNYDYEGNWLDKSLSIAKWAFGDRDNYYRSAYYHDNYPDNYDKYRAIRTPLYRERIIKYQVNPAMTKITTPTMKIKIKSRYPGRSYRRVYAKMAKPTKEQLVFYKNKPSKPDFVNRKKDKNDPPGSDEASKEKGKSGRGKPTEKGIKQTGKPVGEKKPANAERKNVGKPPVQKNNLKRDGKPDKTSKKGGGQGKEKGGKPGKN